MTTKDYKTKTMVKMAKLPVPKDTWHIGLDVGYSAVKVISPNSISCFPAYAAKEKASTAMLKVGLSGADEKDIIYRDENGNVWSAGENVQDSISSGDVTAGSNDIYSRNRYQDPMFKVLVRAGLAAGMRSNIYGNPAGRRIIVQTGLPCGYMENDKETVKKILAGRHRFSVQFAGVWEDFDFTISPEDVSVIDQPQGTLFSLATGPDMHLSPDAFKYFKSKMLIIDIGFGTLDTFQIVRQKVVRSECRTFPEFGMRRILSDTSDEIFKQYHVEISVPTMQQYLEKGTVPVLRDGAYKKTDFLPILEECSRRVCKEAMEVVKERYRFAQDNYDYIVITGGTGDAWLGFIMEDPYFSQSDTFTVLQGNHADPAIANIFSNVRGYYAYSLGKRH